MKTLTVLVDNSKVKMFVSKAIRFGLSVAPSVCSIYHSYVPQIVRPAMLVTVLSVQERLLGLSLMLYIKAGEENAFTSRDKVSR